MMTAMRVLHHELVVRPKEVDKKYKPRQANPTQWMMLRGHDEMSNRLEEHFVSSVEDVRQAAMALQNLMYNWKEGLIRGQDAYESE